MIKFLFSILAINSLLFCAPSEQLENLNIVQLTSKELLSSQYSEKLKMFSKSQAVSFIFFKDLSKEGSINMKVKRPLIDPDRYFSSESIELKELEKLKVDCSVDFPFIPITSQGFLPGERICIEISDSKGVNLKKLSIVPNFLPVAKFSGNRSIQVELSNIGLMIYVIKFKGFQNDETLYFKSKSKNETISRKFKLTKTDQMTCMPAVIGYKGGFCEMTIEDNSAVQESFTWMLPWGEELPYYFN